MSVPTSSFWRKPEFIRDSDANRGFSPSISYDEVKVEIARVNPGAPPITSICPLSDFGDRITDTEITSLGLYYFEITSERGEERTGVWVLPPAR